MVEFIKMKCRKLGIGEEEQNRTEIAGGRSFVYLVMFIKLIFRQSNNAYVVIAMS